MAFESIYLTDHSVRRMAERDIAPAEITAALGTSWGRRADRVVEFPNVRSQARRPTPGMPVEVSRGRTRRGQPSALVLGATHTGRLLHLAVVGGASATQIELLTVWDPTSTENRGRWQTSFLLPTATGAHSLPPQCWVWGDPYLRPLPVTTTRPRPVTPSRFLVPDRKAA